MVEQQPRTDPQRMQRCAGECRGVQLLQLLQTRALRSELRAKLPQEQREGALVPCSRRKPAPRRGCHRGSSRPGRSSGEPGPTRGHSRRLRGEAAPRGTSPGGVGGGGSRRSARSLPHPRPGESPAGGPRARHPPRGEAEPPREPPQSRNRARGSGAAGPGHEAAPAAEQRLGKGWGWGGGGRPSAIAPRARGGH